MLTSWVIAGSGQENDFINYTTVRFFDASDKTISQKGEVSEQ
jgi:hypothetical protein